MRLKTRRIQKEYPKIIYKNPEQKFFDNFEGRLIAIKKLFYNRKFRNMMIAYEKDNDKISIITIHPITDEQIINRIISRRWTRNE